MLLSFKKIISVLRFGAAPVLLGISCAVPVQAQIAAATPDPQRGQAAADLRLAQRDTEARKAIAEAERAEFLARLPPSSGRALAGAVDARQFGAAGLVKAFDLAQQLAADVCAALPDAHKTVIYQAGTAQGMVAARTVQDGLARQNKELRTIIELHTPPGSKVQPVFLAALAVVPATVKAFADMTSLFLPDSTCGCPGSPSCGNGCMNRMGRCCWLRPCARLPLRSRLICAAKMQTAIFGRQRPRRRRGAIKTRASACARAA